MLHITIIVLGKLKESYWREAVAEYLKRLRPWVKLTITELKEESFSEKDDPQTIKEKEADKIAAEIKKMPDAAVILLDQNGERKSSEQLAELVSGRLARQSNNIIFVIGGPLGFHQSLKQTGTSTLSLSALTFTHQMARVILLEQLYRAMMIAHKRPYHY